MLLKGLCFSCEERVGVCAFEPVQRLRLHLVLFFTCQHLILTLGDPSCHSGFVWRLLTGRTEQSDLLSVRAQSLSLGIPVLLWMGCTQALAMPQTPPPPHTPVRRASVSHISFRCHSQPHLADGAYIVHIGWRPCWTGNHIRIRKWMPSTNKKVTEWCLKISSTFVLSTRRDQCFFLLFLLLFLLIEMRILRTLIYPKATPLIKKWL